LIPNSSLIIIKSKLLKTYVNSILDSSCILPVSIVAQRSYNPLTFNNFNIIANLLPSYVRLRIIYDNLFYREVRKIYRARKDRTTSRWSYHSIIIPSLASNNCSFCSLDLSHFRPSVYLKVLFLEARFLIIKTHNNCKRESQSIDIIIRFSESIWN